MPMVSAQAVPPAVPGSWGVPGARLARGPCTGAGFHLHLADTAPPPQRSGGLTVCGQAAGPGSPLPAPQLVTCPCPGVRGAPSPERTRRCSSCSSPCFAGGISASRASRHQAGPRSLCTLGWGTAVQVPFGIPGGLASSLPSLLGTGGEDRAASGALAAGHGSQAGRRSPCRGVSAKLAPTPLCLLQGSHPTPTVAVCGGVCAPLPLCEHQVSSGAAASCQSPCAAALAPWQGWWAGPECITLPSQLQPVQIQESSWDPVAFVSVLPRPELKRWGDGEEMALQTWLHHVTSRGPWLPSPAVCNCIARVSLPAAAPGSSLRRMSEGSCPSPRPLGDRGHCRGLAPSSWERETSAPLSSPVPGH